MLKLPVKLPLRTILNSAPGLSRLALPPQVSLGIQVANSLGVFGGKTDLVGTLSTLERSGVVKVPPFLQPLRAKILNPVLQGRKVDLAKTLPDLLSIQWLKG